MRNDGGWTQNTKLMKVTLTEFRDMIYGAALGGGLRI